VPLTVIDAKETLATGRERIATAVEAGGKDATLTAPHNSFSRHWHSHGSPIRKIVLVLLTKVGPKTPGGLAGLPVASFSIYGGSEPRVARHSQGKEPIMDNVTLIRIISGVLFVIVLFGLIQRRRKRVN